MLGLRIALRYLFSKKTHNAVNVITGVSLCTTAIATAAIVIVLSVFNGFKKLAADKYSRFDAPFRIERTDDRLFPLDSVEHVLAAMIDRPDISGVVTSKAFLACPNGQTVATLMGVDENFLGLSSVKSAVIEGATFVGDTLGAVWGIAGAGVAVALHNRPGTGVPVKIYVPAKQGRINPANIMRSFSSDSIYIAGVFQIEDPKIDDAVFLAPAAFVRHVAGVDSGMVSYVNVYNAGPEVMRTVTANLEATGQFTVKNIEQQNPESFKMINIEKWISFALLIFIFVVASLNLISTLTILIIEKQSNMHILNAMGYSSVSIKKIFAWEGVLLSLFGGVLGSVIGLLLAGGQQMFGWVKFNSDIDPAMLTISSYPVELQLNDFLLVLAVVIILSIVTTFLSLSTFTFRNYEK